MKMRQVIFSLLLVFFIGDSMPIRGSKISSWDSQRKGANWFNEVPTKDWLVAAKRAGITVVRLAPNSWKSSQRDFLIGNADHYNGVVEQDFQKLSEVLDQAEAVGIKIVLTTLSLPGARWRQQNGDKWDFRLWHDPRFLPQAVQFWRDLAKRLRGHPAVIGYDILNEPQPERASGLFDPQTHDMLAWYAKVENTPADLNRFNTEIVKAIREVDEETPIVLSCDTVYVIEYLRPLRDDKIIYSFHMYEPWEYTNKKTNNGRFSYPGKMKVDVGTGTNTKGPAVNLNREELEKILASAVEWQRRNKIPSNRIFVGEFGCHRLVGGAANYLEDLIKIFDTRGWHWAFYAFREDKWDGMDYELGTKPLGESYWKAKERGENPPLKRVNNPLWNMLERELKK
jgi:aryl-phospho-beta-D-glucosidase BglC (GH1 family)